MFSNEKTTSKNFLYLPEKNNFPPKERISYNYQKKQFSKQIVSYREKVKALNFKCVLNTALLFFMLEKLKKVLNKLI